MALSFETTGKYTSERHEAAKQNGKLTAGEAARIMTKALGQKVYAKELKEYSNEWHHSGFYSKGMGKTWFFTTEEVEELINTWPEKQAIKKEEAEKQNALDALAKSTMYGLYWVWEKDYSGLYGKKRNYKALCFYQGNAYNAPTKNFTEITAEQYDSYHHHEGKGYYGWDEPTLDSIMQLESIADKEAREEQEKKEQKLARRRELYKLKKEAEKAAKIKEVQAQKLQELTDSEDLQAIFKTFFENEMHPAPKVVFDAKVASGQSWNTLRDIYKN